MEKILERKGAGYSIEVVLSAVILFTFAYGAVNVPQQKDWSSFQREIAVRDLSYTFKKTGGLDDVLENSNPGAIRSVVDTVSGRDLRVSGTVENLPLNELLVGFHTMPGEIHTNFTEGIEPGDECEGDLAEIDASSEQPVLKTNSSQFLENKHGVRLYFADTDARIPGGYNGEVDYDALWADNGTRCVFTPAEGPYMTDNIFLWGNTTDSKPEIYYDFKNFNASRNSFTVYRAEQAAEFQSALSKPVNGIETDTAVDTFNFSSNGINNFHVTVFQENESLSRIDTYENEFRSLLSNSSVLFLMNLSSNDLNKDFMEDIGFQWLDASYGASVTEYQATFSDYTTSEEIQTYFQGVGGSVEEVSLKPGGKVISSQGTTKTSGNDLLYARNLAFDTSNLNGVEKTGTETNIGSTCQETQAEYSFPGTDHDVRNIDLGETGSAPCGQRRGLEIRVNGEWKGPYLENEIVTVNSRTYIPNIQDEHTATFVFAGSKKVELINHRKVLEGMSGGRVARAAYERDYSESDIKMLSSVIYWLRGDQVQFEGTGGTTSVSTTVVGGLQDRVFMPYKVDLRWSE